MEKPNAPPMPPGPDDQPPSYEASIQQPPYPTQGLYSKCKINDMIFDKNNFNSHQTAIFYFHMQVRQFQLKA